MATTHISEADAASDFPAIMERIRAGEGVIIESNSTPVAVVRPAPEFNVWPISESLARAREYEEELGYSPTVDPEYAADLEDIIRSRKPADRSAWD